MFTLLLLIFTVYGCEFSQLSEAGFLSSWLWSLGQRFLVNEPFIILFGFLLPLLFATEFCANLCTESCNNVLTVVVTVVIKSLKSVRRV